MLAYAPICSHTLPYIAKSRKYKFQRKIFFQAAPVALVDSVDAGLADLRRAKTRVPLGASGTTASPKPPERHARTRGHLRASIDLLSTGVDGLPHPSECLRKLLGSSDTYSGSSQLHVAPYDHSLLKVATGSECTVDLETLLTGEALDMAQHADTKIVCSSALEASPHIGTERVFYSDPVLRCKDSLLQLIHSLISRGLIVFRLTRICSVLLFTVWKKDGFLRLVVDGRVPNALCYVPPKT